MYDVAWAELTIGMKADVARVKILEMGKAFLATPMGMITAMTAAVLGLGAIITGYTDKWQKEVKAAQDALEKNNENISKYQDEISNLEELHKRLQDAQGDKQKLAAIQGELNSAIGQTKGLLNGEADAYDNATKKLLAQIEAKKELLAQEQQEAVENNTKIFEEKGIKNTFLGADWLATDTGGEELREAAKMYQESYRKIYNELIEEGYSIDEAAEKAAERAFSGTSRFYEFKFDKSDWDAYWAEQVSTAYSVFENTISNYSGFGGSDFIKQIIKSEVESGKSLDDIQSILQNIMSDDIQPLVDEYLESLKDPNVDSEAIYDEIIKKLDEIKKKYPELSPVIDGFAKNYIDALTNVSDATDTAETSFKTLAKTLSDGLDKLSDKKDILSEVKEELDSFGAISADNISKILEQFSKNDDVQKAVAYYLSGLGTAQQVYDAMAKGYQNDLKLQAQNLADKMQNDEKYYESIGGLNKSFTDWLSSNYNVDLRNCTTLAKTKLEVEQSLIKKLKKDWSGYYGIQADNLEMIQRQAALLWYDQRRWGNPNDAAYKQAKSNWENATEAYRQYLQMEEKLNNLTLSSFSSTGFNASLSTDFDKSSGKTEAEKYFEKLKYQLETNQITQEQYLKDLDWGYKHFYNKTAEYLEDYAKYSQEVYDGFKDMYKEDLEAQKEAWEEKKDAVSEYYDNLREQIEDAHDEEDYEKEQSEKRKEIFDLDMQIAELMRDGSEKAKARIAELEEERLKAEEDLRDFETDKARENELSRLEKEQKAEEDKIQQQIDGIQGQLDKLDEDTISVRNAIISYARAKGVTLDFAYASGTRSSVGGFGRINEKGIEMISAPDGNGNYVNLMPNSYVFSAKATEFLWKLATEHSLPQAMYNSIAKSIKTQSSTPSVNIAQPITITMGDIIIKGNADKQTVADIKKEQENTVRMVLQKIKELQK